MNATVEELLARLEQLEARVDEHSLFPGASADVLFLLVASLNVFFMQCGFGMLEAGSVTSRSTQAILLKNLLDACLSAFIWWVMGHGIAFDGTNDFIGTAGSDMSSFFLSGYGSGPDSGYHRVFWWFQWTFAAAAGTIVSGAVAERAQLLAYLAYTFILTAVIYPIIVHWCWSEAGWLSTKNGHVDSGGNFTSDAVLDGVIDFAGSGVVHLTGGTAGFFGALIIGPRHGRFEVVYDGSKPPRRGRPLQLPGHAPVLQALGTFILWLGWYGFNAGSQLRIATPGASEVIGRIVVNTTLSAAGSGLVSLAIATLGQWRRGTVNYEVPAICNGILAGLVSITAGCATVHPWAALVIGMIGGLVYRGCSHCVLHKLKDAERSRSGETRSCAPTSARAGTSSAVFGPLLFMVFAARVFTTVATPPPGTPTLDSILWRYGTGGRPARLVVSARRVRRVGRDRRRAAHHGRVRRRRRLPEARGPLLRRGQAARRRASADGVHPRLVGHQRRPRLLAPEEGGQAAAEGDLHGRRPRGGPRLVHPRRGPPGTRRARLGKHVAGRVRRHLRPRHRDARCHPRQGPAGRVSRPPPSHMPHNPHAARLARPPQRALLDTVVCTVVCRRPHRSWPCLPYTCRDLCALIAWPGHRAASVVIGLFLG